MMVVYVPSTPQGPMLWVQQPFLECFGPLQGSRSNWVVPGTWPAWML